MVSVRSSCLLLVSLLPASPLWSQRSLADAVNPLIGTAADGQTFPSAGVPFAMTEWTPQTRAGETKCVAPYYAADTRIQGFRGSHFLSGSCTQDYGSMTVMPLLAPPDTSDSGRSSALDRNLEHSRAYLYSVQLDNGIRAEITGTERCGVMRFRFPAGRNPLIALQENHRLGTGRIVIDPVLQEVRGENPVYRIYAGNGRPAGFSGYFVAQFSRRFTPGGTWSDGQRHPGTLEQTGDKSGAGAYVAFGEGTEEVVVRIGTSFTSIDEARKNLAEVQGFAFDKVATEAKAKWEKSLGAVRLGPRTSPSQKSIFYTAMFHSMLLPRISSDLDGSYPKFGGGGEVEHAQGFTYYDDYSIWDTFRAVHPLFTLFDPARERDMVLSLLAKGEQGQFLPIFPAWNSYTSEMVGDHADAILADAYAKGIREFDAQKAFELMLHNASASPPTQQEYLDGRGRRGLESYLKYGYIPLEDHMEDAFHPNEQVSRTLEYAYDDFLVGEMAGWTGHADIAETFAKRAENYKNVIDPGIGYARGRHADGSWVTQFDPNKPVSWITEGLPSQYTFFVLQDIPGLIKWLGGRSIFISRLDDLFREGTYDHGNEPSHHLAYLYNAVGEPEKTQFHVRKLLKTMYRSTPDGLAGNDDAGQISAWYVFSAMGFYPVTPGTPRYELGVPLHDEAILRLPNGHTLRILARGAEDGRYRVRRVVLNGRVLKRSYVLHDEIMAGGQMTFELLPNP